MAWLDAYGQVLEVNDWAILVKADPECLHRLGAKVQVEGGVRFTLWEWVRRLGKTYIYIHVPAHPPVPGYRWIVEPSSLLKITGYTEDDSEREEIEETNDACV